MGIQARMMGQAMRKLAGEISKTKTVVIFINQLRMKIGVMFGNPETTTGGNALKFYASVRLDVRATNIKEGEQLSARTRPLKLLKIKWPAFQKSHLPSSVWQRYPVLMKFLIWVSVKNHPENGGVVRL
jgi:recombination protein RecA